MQEYSAEDLLQFQVMDSDSRFGIDMLHQDQRLAHTQLAIGDLYLQAVAHMQRQKRIRDVGFVLSSSEEW